MSLILNIDTALEKASICLAKNGRAITTSINKDQKDHASWLQTAIAESFNLTGFQIKDLDAVAVTIGPGSYTGLRVGLASAKGLCYALNIPLITVSTLELMASAVKSTEADLLCPMIDARRMEVFTAVYTKQLDEVIKPQARILDKDFLSDLLNSNSILIFGSGYKKFKTLQNRDNVFYDEVIYDASNMASLSYTSFHLQKFTDLAYSEPKYLKDFFSTSRKSTI